MHLAKYASSKYKMLNGNASFIVIKCNMNMAYTFTCGNVGMRCNGQQRNTQCQPDPVSVPPWEYSETCFSRHDIYLRQPLPNKSILYIWVKLGLTRSPRSTFNKNIHLKKRNKTHSKKLRVTNMNNFDFQ